MAGNPRRRGPSTSHHSGQSRTTLSLSSAIPYLVPIPSRPCKHCSGFLPLINLSSAPNNLYVEDKTTCYF
ncbi:hypothetical protein J5N97_014035 [Dioscorea zingiberensis]|uniref:Uncharacterized protein n=1 Tax=Dioscorea zingiberensis TaxID=325984 RepID=A0A9D5CRM5_9LILI|nr:hypothetical protein J5N97_014035 [Dioscorea zingiberensis]